MALAEIFNQARQLYEQFKQINFNEAVDLSKNLQPWNGLDSSDILPISQSIIEILDDLFTRDPLQLPVTFHSLNTIKSHMQNTMTYYGNLIKTKDQNQFNKFMSQLSALQHQIQASGLFNLLKIYPNIEQISQETNMELQKLKEGNSKFLQLETNLKSLTAKAVSGSLSSAFETLKNEIDKEKKFWFRMVIGAVVVITGLIILFEFFVLKDVSDKSGDNTTLYWLMRVTGIAPSFYFLWFAMSQYKKERALVQEYAHRFAVATSIPSYRDQLKDEKAKDDISVAASHVIFDVPVANEKEANIDKSIKRMTELMGILRR